jgi:hypothetical protein
LRRELGGDATSMSDLRAHWAKLETLLRTLLEEFPSLPARDRATVVDYIDHNEHGLAFERLCFCLKEERLPLSPPQYEMIVNLQGMMRIQNVAETVRDLVER